MMQGLRPRPWPLPLARLEGRLLAVLDQQSEPSSRHTRIGVRDFDALGFAATDSRRRCCARRRRNPPGGYARSRRQCDGRDEDHAIAAVAAHAESPLAGIGPPNRRRRLGRCRQRRSESCRIASRPRRVSTRAVASSTPRRNLVSETEFDEATDEVEIARAELAGRQDEVVPDRVGRSRNRTRSAGGTPESQDLVEQGVEDDQGESQGGVAASLMER